MAAALPILAVLADAPLVGGQQKGLTQLRQALKTELGTHYQLVSFERNHGNLSLDPSDANYFADFFDKLAKEGVRGHAARLQRERQAATSGARTALFLFGESDMRKKTPKPTAAQVTATLQKIASKFLPPECHIFVLDPSPPKTRDAAAQAVWDAVSRFQPDGDGSRVTHLQDFTASGLNIAELAKKIKEVLRRQADGGPVPAVLSLAPPAAPALPGSPPEVAAPPPAAPATPPAASPEPEALAGGAPAPPPAAPIVLDLTDDESSDLEVLASEDHAGPSPALLETWQALLAELEEMPGLTPALLERLGPSDAEPDYAREDVDQAVTHLSAFRGAAVGRAAARAVVGTARVARDVAAARLVFATALLARAHSHVRAQE